MPRMLGRALTLLCDALHTAYITLRTGIPYTAMQDLAHKIPHTRQSLRRRLLYGWSGLLGGGSLCRVGGCALASADWSGLAAELTSAFEALSSDARYFGALIYP